MSAATFGVKTSVIPAASSSKHVRNPCVRKYGIFDNFDGYYWETRDTGTGDFLSVVRTGNFVWCWYREFENRAIYVLIDVVPDPQVEYQLGNNIAYPALLNGSVGEITYAVTPAR